MTSDKITARLVDAFSLLDFSERLLDEIETVPLSELPRIINLLKKNLRDAKVLINDAEKEFDEMVREIDEEEEKAVLGG